MSFHNRYISNIQVIKLFNDSGIAKVINWYTEGADAIVTEIGLASKISSLLNSRSLCKEKIIALIYKEIKVKDDLKK